MTKSLSSILKSSVVKQDEVRIINSNEIVARKLEHIAEVLEENQDEDFTDGFSVGIHATDVAELIRDEAEDDIADSLTQDVQKGENKTDIRAVNQAASDILQKANAEAEEILQNARAEAEQIKKQAMEEGHSEGYSQGLRSGQAALAVEEEKLKQKEKQLEAEFAERVEEMEPQLIDTITSIYEYIFNVELVEDKQIVVHLVNATLMGLSSNAKKFQVRISQEDYAYVSMQKKAVISGTGVNPDSVNFVEDSALPKGQCIIETDNGIFDCSLQTQLANLKKDLVLLSYQKE